jgi:hypothetical protein
MTANLHKPFVFFESSRLCSQNSKYPYKKSWKSAARYLTENKTRRTTPPYLTEIKQAANCPNENFIQNGQ